ncbi:MAG: DUF86 domain-containing protein [Eggerthellaceae bacterium]|nr:DUF86 domain-containing protein [Eggerthellaceae bacterium]
MNAKHDDLSRIQEIYDVTTQTLSQIREVGFTKERFVSPKDAEDDLMAEGLTNRVFRVAEEGGKLSSEFERYGFELREMSGLRNILAHAYGHVDKKIVWTVLETDFPQLIAACEAYCSDRGIELGERA